MSVFVRTPYNYDTNEASKESAIYCIDESRTKQSFADESDINTIVKRFGLTGQLPDIPLPPTYADFSEGVVDFHTAMNMVAVAHESFDTLDAHVRARFHNDPGEFLSFCEDHNNLDEMRKLGIALPPKVEIVPDKPISPAPDPIVAPPAPL